MPAAHVHSGIGDEITDEQGQHGRDRTDARGDYQYALDRRARVKLAEVSEPWAWYRDADPEHLGEWVEIEQREQEQRHPDQDPVGLGSTVCRLHVCSIAPTVCDLV